MAGPHQPFDLGDRLRRGAREDLRSACRNERVVLDPDADSGELRRHIGRGTYVAAGLDRENHAGLERAPPAVFLVIAGIVYVEAEPVAGAVHVELPVALR